jgi:hypothetical protein
MKYITCFLLLIISISTVAQTKPKMVAECTLEFSVIMSGGNQPDSTHSSSLTLYIKGQQSRIDFVSPSFRQVKYYDAKTKSAVILQDLGATKVRRDLDSAKWNKLNERYEGITMQFTDEKKTILGYECKKANIILRNGTAYSLFYAVDIVPSTKEYEFQFRGIPGFVLEYEAAGEGGTQKVVYTATKINLSPVAPAKFEVPKTGYRIM